MSDDLRVRVVGVTKVINLEQLAAEVGFALTASGRADVEGEAADIVVCEDDASITQDELKAAIRTHVPVWPVVPDRVKQVDDALVAAKAGNFDALGELLKEVVV